MTDQLNSSFLLHVTLNHINNLFYIDILYMFMPEEQKIDVIWWDARIHVI